MEIKIDQRIKNIQEELKMQDTTKIRNPILQRCTEKQINPENNIHQAYDRMHHKHNRS